MSSEHPKIDPVAVARGAANHEIHVKAKHEEMTLARSNSSTANALASGVKEVKGAKVEAKQKEQKAQVEGEIPVAVEKLGEEKAAKEATKEKFHEAVTPDQVARSAVQHSIRVDSSIQEMKTAEKNAETAHALASGVKEVKGAKVEAKQKEHKAQVEGEIPVAVEKLSEEKAAKEENKHKFSETVAKEIEKK